MEASTHHQRRCFGYYPLATPSSERVSKLERLNERMYLSSDAGIMELRTSIITPITSSWSSNPEHTCKDFQSTIKGDSMKAIRDGAVHDETSLERLVFDLSPSSWDAQTFHASDEPELSKWRIEGGNLEAASNRPLIPTRSLHPSSARPKAYAETTFNREVGLIRWPEEDQADTIPTLEL